MNVMQVATLAWSVLLSVPAFVLSAGSYCGLTPAGGDNVTLATEGLCFTLQPRLASCMCSVLNSMIMLVLHLVRLMHLKPLVVTLGCTALLSVPALVRSAGSYCGLTLVGG